MVQSIGEVVKQDIVDIMLVSNSNLEILTEQGVFEGSSIQPAIRANEATDVFGGIRGQGYTQRMSRPHRSAVLANAKTDLGLYSMTFNNDLDADLLTLEAFKEFRAEAGTLGFRYFLEVFNPNAPVNLDPDNIAHFINDHIVRSLAGVVKANRPLFLKIPFNGPAAIEELVTFDPTLIVGVLGGGAGTTRDAFELVYQAERHGARLALFGRKINLAEAPLTLIALMREVANGTILPYEAVKAYHAALKSYRIVPARNLDEDLQVTEAPLKAARSPEPLPR
jgi:hypothetical protein